MKLEVAERHRRGRTGTGGDGLRLVPAAPGPHPGAHHRRRRDRVADLGARWDRAGQRRGLRVDGRLGARGIRRRPRPRSHRLDGVPVPPHCGGRRLRGDDRAHCRPPSRDRARIGKRPRRGHDRRRGGHRHFVPLPPGAARRAVARLLPAHHGGDRLRRRARCRGRAQCQPPALHGRGQRHQLGRRGCVGDRAPANPLPRVHRVPPGPYGVVRHRRDVGGHRGAGGDRPAPPGGLARIPGCGRGGGDRPGPARLLGR